jgi:hypothetical protein
MPTITSIEPFVGVRGIEGTGTEIAINGTAFGATVDTSTVMIGGKAATIKASGGWSATQILCYPAVDTPYGANDVVVTIGGVAVTVVKGILIYDPTNNDDNDELKFGMPGEIFINGVHIGHAVGPVNITHHERTVPYQPNDVRGGPILERVVDKWDTVAFVGSQINGSNVATAIGGTYNAASGQVKVKNPAGTNKPEYSVYFTDEHGIQYFYPRCRLNDLSPINLGAEDWQGLSYNFTAYQISQDNNEVCTYQYPAAS